MALELRVVARFLSSAKDEVPVYNKEYEEVVWVLPETLKDNPSKYKPVREEDLKPPVKRGKPPFPKKPRKPDKPDYHHDTIPAPVKPPIPKKPLPPPRPPTRPDPERLIPKPPHPPQKRDYFVPKPKARPIEAYDYDRR